VFRQAANGLFQGLNTLGILPQREGLMSRYGAEMSTKPSAYEASIRRAQEMRRIRFSFKLGFALLLGVWLLIALFVLIAMYLNWRL